MTESTSGWDSVGLKGAEAYTRYRVQEDSEDDLHDLQDYEVDDIFMTPEQQMENLVQQPKGSIL